MVPRGWALYWVSPKFSKISQHLLNRLAEKRPQRVISSLCSQERSLQKVWWGKGNYSFLIVLLFVFLIGINAHTHFSCFQFSEFFFHNVNVNTHGFIYRLACMCKGMGFTCSKISRPTTHRVSSCNICVFQLTVASQEIMRFIIYTCVTDIGYKKTFFFGNISGSVFNSLHISCWTRWSPYLASSVMKCILFLHRS